MLNKIILIGRLTKDPELKKVGDHNLLNFTLAVAKDKENANFFQITAWNKDAEFVSNYAHKGDLLAVEGRLDNRVYEDSTGAKRYVTDIIANRVIALSTTKTVEEKTLDQVKEEMNQEYKRKTEGVSLASAKAKIKKEIEEKYQDAIDKATKTLDNKELPF